MTGFRRRRSLRLRITAGALVVVVAALSGAGMLLIYAVQREMVAQIDTTLTANADFIDRSLKSGEGLPVRVGPTDLYVQFVTPDGRVIGSSTSARGLPALGRVRAAPSGRIAGGRSPVLGDLRVLVKRTPTNPKMLLVLARSSSNVAAVRRSLVRLLVAMGAAGCLMLALLIWVVVGRALRPVDEMRRTVNAISERDLHRRITEPGTGDELDRLADTLNGLLARLDVAVARERRFVDDASHELRTPIAGVRALLETEPADAHAVVAVRADALARLSHLQDLVDELLVLAKAADGGRGAPARSVDLDDLVLGQARQLTRTTNLRIDTTRVSGGQVLGRDIDLARVVENLATNAARHARATVAFSVRQVDGAVEFTVTDDGPGIAVADRVRIFERFRTLEDARTAGLRRAGLGLSIASAIVAAHRGSICAEDAPGGGARFVVRLPTDRAPTTMPVASPLEIRS